MYKGYVRLDAVIKSRDVAVHHNAPSFDVWVHRVQIEDWSEFYKSDRYDNPHVITYKTSLSDVEMVRDLFVRGYLVTHDGPVVRQSVPVELTWRTPKDLSFPPLEFLEACFRQPLGRLFLLDPRNRCRCPFFKLDQREESYHYQQDTIGQYMPSCSVWKNWGVECPTGETLLPIAESATSSEFDQNG